MVIMAKGRQQVRRLIRGEITQPDLRDLSAHFAQLVGGARALAKMLLHEFHSAKEGSMTRAKILDMVLWIMKTAADKEGPVKDTDLLTEEDLAKEAWEVLGEDDGAVEQPGGGGADSPPQPASASGPPDGTASGDSPQDSGAAAVAASPDPLAG